MAEHENKATETQRATSAPENLLDDFGAARSRPTESVPVTPPPQKAEPAEKPAPKESAPAKAPAKKPASQSKAPAKKPTAKKSAGSSPSSGSKQAKVKNQNAKEDKDSPSFRERVLLLSTTHFGLATPVLNIQREKKADALAESIIKSEREALKKVKKLTFHNINGTDFLSAQLKTNGDFDDASQIILSSPDLKSYTVMALIRRNCASEPPLATRARVR